MRDIAFMLMFIGMMPAALRYVHAGTMLWAWTALAGPSQYLYGFAAGLPLNKIAVAVTAIALFVDQTKRKPYIDGHIALLLLFLLQGAVSFSVGLSDLARPYDLMDRMTKITALCVVMTIANRGRMQIHAMAIIVCLGMGIHGVLEGLKYLSSGGAHIVIAPATVGDNNTLALATLMVMPLLVYLYRYSVSQLIRLSCVGALLACFVGVIATASRGGLIGLVVLGGFLLLQSRHKLLSLMMMGVLAAGLVTFAPASWRERMDTIGSAEQDDSFMGRVSSWKLHTMVALDRPLLGGGYSPLEDPQVSAAYRARPDIFSFIPSPPLQRPLAAHSNYFEVLGDLGFFGLFLFLALLLTGLRNTARIRRRVRGDPSLAWADDLAAVLRITLVVYMVSGAALSAAYSEILYIMLTQISVLRRHVEETVLSPAGAGVDRPKEKRPGLRPGPGRGR
jgi:probable O-glycosylation ligase (exosortase A-associated)